MESLPNHAYHPSLTADSSSQAHSTSITSRSLIPQIDTDGDLKRRRLSPDVYQATTSRPTPRYVPLPDPLSSIPKSALLYHFAISAHRASHTHYQQAFVHSSISSAQVEVAQVVPLYHTRKLANPFVHDPHAAAKALDLQLLALDFLRAGLSQPGLSEREKVAFGLEFGIIGLKVYRSCHEPVAGKGKDSDKRQTVDTGRLIEDLQEVIGQSYFVSGKQTSFTSMRLQLELLNARLAFVQSKFNLGKRMIQQSLSNNKENTRHRYALYLLYLEFVESTGSADFLIVADDLMAEAHSKNHVQVIQLAALTKARFVFVSRKWEYAAQALSSLSAVLGIAEDLSNIAHFEGSPVEKLWHTSVLVHYLTLRALWEGRTGNDTLAKTTLQTIYTTMDGISESGIMNTIRANGGVMTIQMTPPNILYLLVYLTTAVSRRELTGSNATCKNILHSKALRHHEDFVRAADMWDAGFSDCHDVLGARNLQKQVMAIRGEMMLEHAMALIFRSDFEAAFDTVDHLRAHDLFQLFAPHLCLLFAQHAMQVGAGTLATTYYQACLARINTDSEFGVIATIGLIGNQGKLLLLTQNPTNRDLVNILVEKCKGSTSAMFNAAGYLLASLTDENVVNSKKKLSTAYEICSKSNNNVLRLLIFAFTTSTHHYGGRERMFRQLIAGRDLAKLMGGRDRPDGVGQVVLGLWFNYRLKEYYRQEGSQERTNQAREAVTAHLARLEAVKSQAAALQLVDSANTRR
ncbi:uncharacterized protein I303_102481 [Kwoniella dejecticola CBS 10117]|uniref:Uncharacterized protein n=1 Tax=Kwoniella dejecticola CBS 10117 TaxID=1296121 RepID=A0AAJ8KK49_9TREE